MAAPVPPLPGARARPPLKPRDVKCPHCAAGLPLKDEHARMVVCEYCGAQVELGEVEAKVLGRKGTRKWPFAFEIGQRFTFQGVRYEVAARLVYIEDDDEEERTFEYLLFSPRRGSLFLSEYEGTYSLSRPVHVMPRHADVFTLKRGDKIHTYDGRMWALEERGEYELVHVDGALPWVAKVGDTIEYATFDSVSGNRDEYEVERTGGEIEFSQGRALTPAELRRAAGRDVAGAAGPKVAPDRAKAPGAGAAATSSWFNKVIVLSFVFMMFNLVAGMVAMGKGRTAVQLTLDKSRLSAGDVLTDPFELPAGLVRVDVQALGLSGQWLAADIAVVEGDDDVTHVLGSDLAYYQGYEDGESWSEGSQDESLYVEIDRAGPHRLLVRAQGGAGESETPGPAPTALQVRLVTGATMPHGWITAGIVCGIVFVILLIARAQWKKSGDDDEDDDDDD